MLAQCGTPVVIHDETLERTTEGVGRVSAMPWSALKHLRLRDASGQLTDALLPSFEDVLSACEALSLSANVEIKPAAGAAWDTGRVVADHVLHSRALARIGVLLTSFERAALDAAMAMGPGLEYGHLFDGDPGVALTHGDLRGCRHLVFSAERLAKADVQRAMSQGYEVAVYTVNEPIQARCLRSWGCAGIISDLPHTLVAALDDDALA